tara:strand:- start:47 stop:235 length:189 start_codon:yes stop_codon:yes gene_type:complete
MKKLKFPEKSYFQKFVDAGIIKNFEPKWGKNRSAVSECLHKCTNGSFMKVHIEVLGYYSSPK